MFNAKFNKKNKIIILFFYIIYNKKIINIFLLY